MIELLTIVGISLLGSFGIAALRVAAEEGSIKIKEKQQGNNIFSWLFLYPLFKNFSNWLERFRQALLRLGNAVLTLLRIIIVLVVVPGLAYLVYILIKAIF